MSFDILLMIIRRINGVYESPFQGYFLGGNATGGTHATKEEVWSPVALESYNSQLRV